MITVFRFIDYVSLSLLTLQLKSFQISDASNGLTKNTLDIRINSLNTLRSGAVHKFAIQIPLMAILTQQVKHGGIIQRAQREYQSNYYAKLLLVSRDGRIGAVYRQNGLCLATKYFVSRSKARSNYTQK